MLLMIDQLIRGFMAFRTVAEEGGNFPPCLLIERPVDG